MSITFTYRPNAEIRMQTVLQPPKSKWIPRKERFNDDLRKHPEMKKYLKPFAEAFDISDIKETDEPWVHAGDTPDYINAMRRNIIAVRVAREYALQSKSYASKSQ